jgi:hypothetical protein
MTTPPGVFYAAVEASTISILSDAYWEQFEERVAFLDTLVAQGRDHEALTLCIVYLDGLAHTLAEPDSKNGVSFCTALAMDEPEPYFALIHPLQLIRATKKMASKWQLISAKLASSFPAPSYELFGQTTFLATIRHVLDPTELAEIETELWRGTVAAIAYGWVRNPTVHELGGSAFIEFSQTTYDGKRVPSLTYATLADRLKPLAAAARAQAKDAGRIQ